MGARSSEVVVFPFGKHRGEAVDEVLRTDPQWVEWVMAQAWFRERHPTLVQVIIAGGGAEAAETPEHNRMQALFLRREVCVAAYFAAGAEAEDRDGYVTLWSEGSGRRVSKDEVDDALAKMVEFEVWGWDVRIGDVLLELKPSLGDDYPAVLRAMKARRQSRFGECHRALIVDAFSADGATWDDVVRIFAASKIRVLRLSEITGGGRTCRWG